MKLPKVIFTLFVVVGTVRVRACNQHLVWNVTTLAVECASEEVQNHWTEALANMDPYEELVHEERLQLYNEWKAEAWAIVNNNADDAHFRLYKNVQPIVKFYNTFAPPDACLNETDEFVQKVRLAMNGIMGSSVLDSMQDFVNENGVRRMLRGQQRELCSSDCLKSYWCRYANSCRRRRLDGAENLLNLIENTPERLEAVTNSIEVEIQEQCEHILKDIAAYSGQIDSQCRNTLAAVRCDVEVEVWETLSLVVGSTEMFAADMIRAMLLAAQGPT